MKLKSISVFCGSSSKIDPHYLEQARELGRTLAQNNIRLVYGAGNLGTMGALADSVLEHGGCITGVIPQFMVDAGWHHESLTELIITPDMHQRKQRMSDLSDAVVALPGGVGTFEELFEIITWKQLGLLTKPIVIANINGYYDPLIQMLERAVDQQFMRSIHATMWTIVNNTSQIINAILNSPAWDTSARKIAAI